MSSEHIFRVRILYKGILRLHRGLPLELKALGDNYVRAEFKQHKNCDPEFIPTFMNEWTKYAFTLAQQLGKKSVSKQLGLKLSEEQIDQFSEEQVAQLYELFKETQKPVDPVNPLGANPRAVQSEDN